MNPIKILEKHYSPDSLPFHLLIEHGKMVGKKALEAAAKVAHLHPDLKFIEEAAMLHDIGIKCINEPKLECFGVEPYVCHGFRGREILEAEGLPWHALVCERHVGVGITLKDIERENLPLPKRDMSPISLEEQLICFADKFFSKKDPTKIHQELPLDEIRASLAKFGKDKIDRFDEFLKKFG